MRACARCWTVTSDCRDRGLTDPGRCVGCGSRWFVATGSLTLRG
jgi:DNA-directed RNA polymerase subunit RPC12/RpoP